MTRSAQVLSTRPGNPDGTPPPASWPGNRSNTPSAQRAANPSAYVLTAMASASPPAARQPQQHSRHPRPHAEWISAKLASRPTEPDAEPIGDGSGTALCLVSRCNGADAGGENCIVSLENQPWLSLPHPNCMTEQIAHALNAGYGNRRSHFLARLQALAPLMVQPAKCC